MTLIQVDPDKCLRDGICAAVCPAQIISFSKEDGKLPVLIDNAEKLCIRCGHCVAVCPEGALAHESMGPTDCPPVREEFHVGDEIMEHLLRSRRSIRVYRDKPVPKQVLERLIDMARYAPSGSNMQPVQWLVILEPEKVQELGAMVVDWMKQLIGEKSPLADLLRFDRVVASWQEGKDRVLRGAPHLVIAHAPGRERTAAAACTIALSYLELAAGSLSLGTCWAGYFTTAAGSWPPLAEALAMPDDHSVFGAMMVGYPRFPYRRLPLRNPARITWQ